MLDTKVPALINDYTHRQWRDLVTQELADFIDKGAIAIIPVKIGNKAIGVVCAQHVIENNTEQIKKDKLIKNKDISTADFQQLCALVEHLNMCLTMIMMR